MGRKLTGNKFVLHYKHPQTDFRKAQFEDSLKCEKALNPLKIVKWLIQIRENKIRNSNGIYSLISNINKMLKFWRHLKYQSK